MSSPGLKLPSPARRSVDPASIHDKTRTVPLALRRRRCRWPECSAERLRFP